ncbi:MAG: hypothetical protein RLY93_17325 [Sumerlaeia bacterium]
MNLESPPNAIALGHALLNRETLELRRLAMELFSPESGLLDLAEPVAGGGPELAAAAAVLELLCDRAGVTPPEWTRSVPALPEPFFAVAAAERMPRLRALCLAESPEPLKKRNIFAPPDFLTFA